MYATSSTAIGVDSCGIFLPAILFFRQKRNKINQTTFSSHLASKIFFFNSLMQIFFCAQVCFIVYFILDCSNLSDLKLFSIYKIIYSRATQESKEEELLCCHETEMGTNGVGGKNYFIPKQMSFLFKYETNFCLFSLCALLTAQTDRPIHGGQNGQKESF